MAAWNSILHLRTMFQRHIHCTRASWWENVHYTYVQCFNVTSTVHVLPGEKMLLVKVNLRELLYTSVISQGTLFFLSESFLPKIPNVGLNPAFWGNLGAKVNFWTSIVSSVWNLQLSVEKLQLAAPSPTCNGRRRQLEAQQEQHQRMTNESIARINVGLFNMENLVTQTGCDVQHHLDVPMHRML